MNLLPAEVAFVRISRPATSTRETEGNATANESAGMDGTVVVVFVFAGSCCGDCKLFANFRMARGRERFTLFNAPTQAPRYVVNGRSGGRTTHVGGPSPRLVQMVVHTPTERFEGHTQHRRRTGGEGGDCAIRISFLLLGLQVLRRVKDQEDRRFLEYPS